MTTRDPEPRTKDPGPASANTLYGFYRSSASYRVRIALNLKDLEYCQVSKHLRSGEHGAAEFVELNPQGLVPVLVHAGQAFNQSLAIIELLEEIEPAPKLLPDTPTARARVRAMAQIVACEMHPLCNLRVLQYLGSTLGCDDDAVGQWYAHWMRLGFEALEAMVGRYGSESRCYGDAITLADVCLVPQVYNASRFGCDMTHYPRLTRIADDLDRLPAFAAAHPDRQPDAGG